MALEGCQRGDVLISLPYNRRHMISMSCIPSDLWRNFNNGDSLFSFLLCSLIGILCMVR